VERGSRKLNGRFENADQYNCRKVAHLRELGGITPLAVMARLPAPRTSLEGREAICTRDGPCSVFGTGSELWFVPGGRCMLSLRVCHQSTELAIGTEYHVDWKLGES
jgi:hypothetical protein